jgi:hypothetical protein
LLYFVRVERRKLALVLRSTNGAAKLAAALVPEKQTPVK